MKKEQVETFLTEAKFTFAKTMSNIPHSWICRKDFNSETFLEVMNYINANGIPEYFYSKKYFYFHIGEYKYWVMTDKNGLNDRTAIINKAKI